MPDPAYSRRVSDVNYSTCLSARSASLSRLLLAPTRTSPGAYRDANKVRSKVLMQAEIACLCDAGVPSSLTEIVTLGRTLKRRAGDILAYFDHPYTSNGPTEAINGRLEHLRGSGLGIRNLIRYITRAFLEPDGFKTQLHPNFEKLNSCECRTRGEVLTGRRSPFFASINHRLY